MKKKCAVINLPQSYDFLFHAAGVPSQGGDYIPPVQSDFVFRPATALRPCIDIIVFNDEVFEGPEEFTITVQGFLLDGSTTVTPSLSGVTVNPSRATVTIRDNDSETKPLAIVSFIMMNVHSSCSVGDWLCE